MKKPKPYWPAVVAPLKSAVREARMKELKLEKTFVGGVLTKAVWKAIVCFLMNSFRHFFNFLSCFFFVLHDGKINKYIFQTLLFSFYTLAFSLNAMKCCLIIKKGSKIRKDLANRAAGEARHVDERKATLHLWSFQMQTRC